MRIAEVSEKYGISADTLRYYERIGLLPRVHRNASGMRDYDENDLGRVEFVKCMRGANVSIESLIEYMQLFDEGESTYEARRQILIEERERAQERLAEIQDGLDRLNKKIAWYEGLIGSSSGED
ncbi:MerR family transcriptional regulator [Paratractidigestivibacter sp.]|uniref:MerR family transcriptional regulator n=1 Tax=Paratractidigestivibacter sp. TaxID=2847316 RepID=UPI002ACB0845|nr:MerR family transcriptional regulator [Paratractidigestivibacter sp.]